MGGRHVAELLLALGVDVDANEDGDFTPLLVAVQEGQVEAVELLLQAGSKVNFVCEKKLRKGATPLIYAAQSGRTRCMQLLLDAGAEVDRRPWMAAPL